MSELTMNVHGATASLKSSDADFTEFVRKNYQYFLSPPANIDVEVDFSYHSYASIKPCPLVLDAFVNMGNGIYYGKNELVWCDPTGLTIRLKLKGDRLVIHSTFQEKNRPSIRYRLFKGRILKQGKFQTYQYIMRQILHFPIFWLLEHRKGMGLIHASAIEKEGRGLIFAGLNGSGKTTLAMYLCMRHSYNLLSDNFLLTNEHEIYAFPEAMRFDQTSLNLLGLSRQSSIPIFGKYHYELSLASIAPKAKPIVLFLTYLGPKTSIMCLKKEMALKKILNIHNFLKEFPKYSYLAMLPFIVSESGVSQEKRILEAVLSKVSCYELQIRKGDPLEQVGHQVMICV